MQGRLKLHRQTPPSSLRSPVSPYLPDYSLNFCPWLILPVQKLDDGLRAMRMLPSRRSSSCLFH